MKKDVNSELEKNSSQLIKAHQAPVRLPLVNHRSKYAKVTLPFLMPALCGSTVRSTDKNGASK